MKSSLRRHLAVSTATAVALVGTLGMSTLSAETANAAAAKKRVTNYAYNGSAYGTFVAAKPVGVGSGFTGRSYLGCTRLAGVRKNRRVAAVGKATGLPLRIGAVTSQTRTYKMAKKGRVGQRSRNTIAKVVIGDPKGVNITVKGLATTSDAFARRGKFGTKQTFRSANISANLPGQLSPLEKLLNEAGAGVGDLLDYLAKQANNSLVLPGIGRIHLGATSKRIRKGYAGSNAVALRINLYGQNLREGGGDDVNVIVGRSRSRIAKNVPSGVFRGSAQAIEGRLLGDVANAKVGPIADKPLPCEGTRGKIRKTSIVGANPLNAGIVDLGVARARVFGVQGKKGYAKTWTEGSVANVKLGSGDTSLVIKGIVGKAKVVQTKAGKIRKSSRGSKVLSITAGGKTYDVPVRGEVLNIPGIAKIQAMIKSGGKRTMKITALRVTLLEGSAAQSVLNFGVARAAIRKQ